MLALVSKRGHSDETLFTAGLCGTVSGGEHGKITKPIPSLRSVKHTIENTNNILQRSVPDLNSTPSVTISIFMQEAIIQRLRGLTRRATGPILEGTQKKRRSTRATNTGSVYPQKKHKTKMIEFKVACR